MKITEFNIWIPGHEEKRGYATHDQQAKLRSEYMIIGAEPACCISAGTAKKAVRDWKKGDHNKIGSV
jgi:hypothetical protein